jgi:hypothetical protein
VAHAVTSQAKVSVPLLEPSQRYGCKSGRRIDEIIEIADKWRLTRLTALRETT